MSVENLPVWLCREGDRVHDWAYGSPGDPHCWFNGPRAHNPECGEYLLADPLVVYPPYLAPILSSIVERGQGTISLTYNDSVEIEPDGWTAELFSPSRVIAFTRESAKDALAAVAQTIKDLRPRNENYAGSPDQEKQ